VPSGLPVVKMSQALFPSMEFCAKRKTPEAQPRKRLCDRFLLLPLLALTLLFSGCDILKSLGLIPNDDEEPASIDWGVVPGAAEIPSIKAKFGVTETDGVTATFQALSTFIKKGGLENDANMELDKRVIKLGDWIDLEDGLTVSGDTACAANFNYPAANTDTRLIVVGINTFNQVNGNSTQHVVFHFQNIPVKRRMNPTSNNGGGYPESEMRVYLTENFLPGLTAAGVLEDVLWGPTRVMSKKENGKEDITDVLWLPTERELFNNGKNVDGAGLFSTDDETGNNQAGLEYYTSANSNSSRAKTYGGSSMWYWEASAHSDSSTYFCYVLSSGNPGNTHANSVGGCAPAFCVY
jgi:hypothetical protein